MRFELITEDEVEITDFEEDIPYELVVKQRSKHIMKIYCILELYYVEFEDGIINENETSPIGNGHTVDEALQDYCKKISNKTLIFGFYSDKPFKVPMPKFKHTKLLNR